MLKKYHIQLRDELYPDQLVVVEANNQEEALEKAKEMYPSYDHYFITYIKY